MSEKRIFITAVIEVLPEKSAQLGEMLRECASLSHQEKACERYEAGADKAKEGRFVISEIWKDQAGFESHLQTAHFKALKQGIETLSGALEVMEVSPFFAVP